MQTPQPTSPQKTSFWDFKNKKIYLDNKEKILDLVFGFVLLYFLSNYLFIPFFELLFDSKAVFSFFSLPHFFDILLEVSVLIFMFFKRRFIFFGMLISIVISIGIVVFLWKFARFQ